MSLLKQGSRAMRDRVNAAKALEEERHPGRYDWGRAGRMDGSPEVIAAERAEAELEDRMVEFVESGSSAGLGAAWKDYLKALEI